MPKYGEHGDDRTHRVQEDGNAHKSHKHHGEGHRSHRTRGEGHKLFKDHGDKSLKDSGDGHQSPKDSDRHEPLKSRGVERKEKTPHEKSHRHHRRESGEARKAPRESGRSHTVPDAVPHPAQSGSAPTESARNSPPRAQDRIALCEPTSPVGPQLGHIDFPGFGSLRYPMRTDPSTPNRDQEAFVREVVPTLQACQNYDALLVQLRQLTEQGWIDPEHPFFKISGKSKYFYIRGNNREIHNMEKELYAEISKPGGISQQALEAIFQSLANQIRENLQQPQYSPPSYSGLIRLCMELRNVQKCLLPTPATQDLGWNSLENVLNHKIWQPIFYKYFPSRYAGLDLSSYQSVQTFPVPYTPYWSPEKWDCLRGDLIGDTNQRLGFKHDYRSVITYVNVEYGTSFLPILRKFFIGDRAFFVNLDKFKNRNVLRYRSKPFVPDYKVLVDRLKTSKTEYLVQSNQPEGGDEKTVDLVGLVAFAYSLLEIETILQETMAALSPDGKYVPQANISERPPPEVTLAICEVLWKPVTEHVFQHIKTHRQAKIEAITREELQRFILDAKSKRLIADSPAGKARAAAFALELEIARERTRGVAEGVQQRERAQWFEEQRNRRAETAKWVSNVWPSTGAPGKP